MCIKCLEPGHVFIYCKNDWKCKQCHQSGHKMIDCPQQLAQEIFDDDMEEKHDTDEESDNENRNQIDTESTKSDQDELDEPQTETKNKKGSSGILSKRQAVRQKDKIPQCENIQKPDENQKEMKQNKTKKTVTISETQGKLDSFIKTPNKQKDRQSKNRTPPSPPVREGGSSKKK